jgi:hypothetical protein
MNESADLEALRRLAATEHGLPPEATGFLTGSTLTELDESAAALAKLLGESRDPEPTAAPAGPFADMAGDRARRKAELAAIFTGRPKPRDERGRFKSTGWDGGARTPVPIHPSPEQAHNELVLQMARISQTLGTWRF